MIFSKNTTRSLTALSVFRSLQLGDRRRLGGLEGGEPSKVFLFLLILRIYFSKSRFFGLMGLGFLIGLKSLLNRRFWRFPLILIHIEIMSFIISCKKES